MFSICPKIQISKTSEEVSIYFYMVGDSSKPCNVASFITCVGLSCCRCTIPLLFLETKSDLVQCKAGFHREDAYEVEAACGHFSMHWTTNFSQPPIFCRLHLMPRPPSSAQNLPCLPPFRVRWILMEALTVFYITTFHTTHRQKSYQSIQQFDGKSTKSPKHSESPKIG